MHLSAAWYLLRPSPFAMSLTLTFWLYLILMLQCPCGGFLMVKPSSQEARNWGPDYNYPYFLGCSEYKTALKCNNTYTQADLERAVSAARPPAAN